MGLSSQLAASSLARPGVCTSSTRPASPYEGQVIYETDTDKVLVWNGSVWTLLKTNIIQPVAQPMFSVTTENGSVVSATNKYTFNKVLTNIGTCWDTANNRFVAPVVGNYEFSLSILNASAAALYIDFYKNGSVMTTGTAPRGYTQTLYSPNVASGIISLNAGDYIELWVTGGTAHNYHSSFYGKLVS